MEGGQAGRQAELSHECHCLPWTLNVNLEQWAAGGQAWGVHTRSLAGFVLRGQQGSACLPPFLTCLCSCCPFPLWNTNCLTATVITSTCSLPTKTS